MFLITLSSASSADIRWDSSSRFRPPLRRAVCCQTGDAQTQPIMLPTRGDAARPTLVVVAALVSLLAGSWDVRVAANAFFHWRKLVSFFTSFFTRVKNEVENRINTE
jgi:hypothetical protein